MSVPESFCAICADRGRTCCRDTAVFITHGDVRRIARVAGGGDPFYEYRAAGEEAAAPEIFDDVLWRRVLGSDGRRRILLHRQGGDCVFLTQTGCRLSEMTRPLLCRLYPFGYDETAIKGAHAHLCPRPEADNPALLLALLGMNRGRAETWRAMLYREVDEEFS